MRCRIPCSIYISLSIYSIVQSPSPSPPPPSHQLHHNPINPPPTSSTLIHQKPLPKISNLAKKSTTSLPSHPTPPRKRMCLIHQIRCRCGHNGNIQTRCPDNPGRGFTPRCRAHGIRNTGRAPLAGASHNRTSRPPIITVPPPLPLPSHQQLPLGAAAADRTQAGCPRCHEPIYLWGVGREMEALGM